MLIAIDGPAGSGKSTIAKLLAEKLGFQYIDTGAMYRAVTLAALEAKYPSINFSLTDKVLGYEDEDFIKERVLPNLSIKLDGKEVYLSGRNVSKEIRTPFVSNNVAQIAALKSVRENLVKQQQALGRASNCVMDGRDIGTVVFPDADIKIFLTASAEVRAKRRLKDFEEQGEHTNFAALVEDIKARDKYDSERDISPLKIADDAIEINSDDKTIDQVLQLILDEVHKLS